MAQVQAMMSSSQQPHNNHHVGKTDNDGQVRLIVHNQVLDVTSFAAKHPGGRQVLEAYANGCDATDAFLAYHAPEIAKRLQYHVVGDIVVSLDEAQEPISAASAVTTFDDEEEEEHQEDEAESIVTNTSIATTILRRRRRRRKEAESFGSATHNDDNTTSTMSSDYRQLHESFLREGLYKTNPLFYVKVFAWLACVLGTAIGLTLVGTWTITRLAGAFLLGLFWQQVAFVGHDLGHNAVTQNRTTDKWIGLVLGPLVSGISLEWWKATHNLHHVTPNAVDWDKNIQHAPVMAIDTIMFHWFCAKKRLGESSIIRAVTHFLLAHQDVTFYPFIVIVSRYNLYLRSFFYLIMVSDAPGWHPKLDLLALFLFHTWVRALVMTIPHAWEQVAFMMISHAMANVINMQIVLSHFPMPVYRGMPITTNEKCQQKETPRAGCDTRCAMMNQCWSHVQVLTALNVECPTYMDWFHGGLQFQIEHHLWPRLPRHNLRKVKARTMAFCQEHHVPYHSLPFGPALQSVTDTMFQVAEDFRQASCGETSMNKNKSATFMDSLVMKAMTMEG